RSARGGDDGAGAGTRAVEGVLSDNQKAPTVQDPSSREAPNFKSQMTSRANQRGNWDFVLEASLELGVWNLELLK
ncbi:MAG TPA: hypothetical protein VHC44_17035, partial [Verrucomicrobiae bacterium]|nr:hypothetical protein [Verrucomicrobiae bacterium]